MGFFGVFFIHHFSLCSFELHWFIFCTTCELYILLLLFTLVLIFSLQQKNYDGDDDHKDDDGNAKSDNHDQSVVVGRGIRCWKIKQLITCITLYQIYFIICYHY